MVTEKNIAPWDEPHQIESRHLSSVLSVCNIYESMYINACVCDYQGSEYIYFEKCSCCALLTRKSDSERIKYILMLVNIPLLAANPVIRPRPTPFSKTPAELNVYNARQV